MRFFPLVALVSCYVAVIAAAPTEKQQNGVVPDVDVHHIEYATGDFHKDHSKKNHKSHQSKLKACKKSTECGGGLCVGGMCSPRCEPIKVPYLTTAPDSCPTGMLCAGFRKLRPLSYLSPPFGSWCIDAMHCCSRMGNEDAFTSEKENWQSTGCYGMECLASTGDFSK